MDAARDALHRVIGPDTAHLDPWQASARATIIFFVGVFYIRLVGARTFGRGSPLDIVGAVIIGANLSRALTGSAGFVPTLTATLVLVGLHWAVQRLCHRFPPLSRLLKGEPVDLVRDGLVEERALRRDAISRHDLDEALRDKGLESTADVRRAVLERSGQISVIRG